MHKTTKYICTNNQVFFLLVLILASAWILFYRLGDPAFYRTRLESRRALISRDMIQNSHWLVPHLEGKPTLTKPPLYYWAVALLSVDEGVTELSARIPSAAAGVGTVVFLFLLGSLMFNGRAGFLAGLALSVTNFFIHEGRYAEMESMLTFFITASLYFFFKGYSDPGRSGLWYGLFFTMLGLGMTTKGPFALTFPLIPIIAWLWLYREQKLLVQKRFLFGLVFFFAVTLPWPIAVSLQYPRFLTIALWETIGRSVTGFVHEEELYFYFERLDETMFPWILFLPFSLWLVYTKELREQKKQNVFFVLFLLGNLLFMSLLRSKREYYIYPLTPAVAMLVASTWVPMWKRFIEHCKTVRLLNVWSVMGMGALLIIASAAAGNPVAFTIPALDFPETAPFLLLSGVCLCTSAAARMIFPNIHPWRTVFGIIIITLLAAHYVYFTYTVPIRNLTVSGKYFYRNAVSVTGVQAPLVFFGRNENYAFEFYAGRYIETIEEVEKLDSYMAEKGVHYAVMTGRSYQKIGFRPWEIICTSEAAERKKWKRYILFCNSLKD